MNLSFLRKIILFVPALLLIGLGLGCYNSTTGDTSVYGIANFKLPVIPKTGSHKVMVFSEMHYQRSFRSQDVPRILPHENSVPFSGMGGPEISIDSTLINKEIILSSLKEFSPNHNTYNVQRIPLQGIHNKQKKHGHAGRAQAAHPRARRRRRAPRRPEAAAGRRDGAAKIVLARREHRRGHRRWKSP